MSEIQGPATEGIWGEKVIRPEGNLERVKNSHKGNKIYGIDATSWIIQELWYSTKRRSGTLGGD